MISKNKIRETGGVIERLDSVDGQWKVLPPRGLSNAHWRWRKYKNSGMHTSRLADLKYQKKDILSRLINAIRANVKYHLSDGKLRQRIYRSTQKGKNVQRKWELSSAGRTRRRVNVLRWRDKLAGAVSNWTFAMQKIFETKMECAFCGTRKSLQVDHIQPRIGGNAITPDNVSALCFGCNNKKGKKTFESLSLNRQIELKLSNLKFKSEWYIFNQSKK